MTYNVTVMRPYMKAIGNKMKCCHGKPYPLMLVVGNLFCDKRHAKKSATRFSSTNIRVRSVPA